MRKSKNRYFYHILVSPGGASGAITLNVVWMEREFESMLTNCLAACAHLRYSEILVENRQFFHTPLAFDAPVKGFPLE